MIHIIWLIVTLPGLMIWLLVGLLPRRSWSTQPRLETQHIAPADHLRDITVLIPARNEADLIGATIQSVQQQGAAIQIVVIDDNSTDATASIAHDNGALVRSAPPAPADWSGKLWALEQGLTTVDTPLTLLLDADIELSPGIMPRLRQHLYADNLTLASLFVTLRMRSLWEKLLIPTFGYFFRLLYPFRLSNADNSNVAAASGGCILVKTAALKQIGGFAAYHDALIDDCELARQIQVHGGRTWIGLTRAADSRRPYPTLASLWELVARCAYTQLHYSPWQLIVCTILILLAFAAPVAGLFASPLPIRLIGVAALLAMWASYLPTLRYYQRHSAWALTLPAVGLLYLVMTWSSALRYWRGTKSRWKGRDYQA